MLKHMSYNRLLLVNYLIYEIDRPVNISEYERIDLNCFMPMEGL